MGYLSATGLKPPKGQRVLDSYEMNSAKTTTSKFQAWRFKHKVRIPKTAKAQEDAIDASDIRKILKATHNRRLLAFLLVCASSGVRATEAITSAGDRF